MASGRLGAADVAATTNTTVFQCLADTFAVVNLSLCNRTGGAITCRVAVATSGSPSDSDYIEYGVSLLANGVLERTGIVLKTGERIVVYTSGAGISAVCYGIVTSTV